MKWGILMQTIRDKKTSQKLSWDRFGVFDAFNYIFLAILCLVMGYPFFNSVIISFNDGKDAAMGGIYFWPRVFTLSNYATVFSNSTVFLAFLVSAGRTVITTFLNLIVTSMFAYGISKQYLRFRKFYLTLMLITLYFSGGLIPYFLLVRDLGLFNSFWAYVIPGLFSAFNSLIFMSFFQGLPASLEESARIDGASTFRLFFQIVVPISKPVFASITLFTAISQWNSWYDNLLFVKNKDLMTLSFLFIKMIKSQEYYTLLMNSPYAPKQMTVTVTPMSLSLATMVIAVLPIMILYPFTQKYFAKGIMLGSIKG
jgi:putative aldouronate transport system permease protein